MKTQFVSVWSRDTWCECENNLFILMGASGRLRDVSYFLQFNHDIWRANKHLIPKWFYFFEKLPKWFIKWGSNKAQIKFLIYCIVTVTLEDLDAKEFPPANLFSGCAIKQSVEININLRQKGKWHDQVAAKNRFSIKRTLTTVVQ